MGDPSYKRTSGYRNWTNKRGWLPIISKGIASFIDGSMYLIRDDGWRRIVIKGESK